MTNLFLELNTINEYKENAKVLIQTNDIVGIKQKHVESTKLYDQQGNLVEEKENDEKLFQVLVINERGAREKFIINENEYLRVVSLLVNTNA